MKLTTRWYSKAKFKIKTSHTVSHLSKSAESLVYETQHRTLVQMFKNFINGGYHRTRFYKFSKYLSASCHKVLPKECFKLLYNILNCTLNLTASS